MAEQLNSVFNWLSKFSRLVVVPIDYKNVRQAQLGTRYLKSSDAAAISSSSSSYLFIYQVTSYHKKKKKLQLPLGLSPKHRNIQFL